MNQLNDLLVDELYLAGEHVPSGLYRDVDTRREVLLEYDGRLPASLDGRIAAYVCVDYTWRQHKTDEEIDRTRAAVNRR